MKNFRNEIVWCYTGAGNAKKDFPRKHDVIFRYTKTENFDFNQQYVPYKKSNKTAGKTSFSSLNEEDRQKRLEKLDERGKPIESYWVDIALAVRSSKERLGYPTQKPEKLLERIILASSNTNTI